MEREREEREERKDSGKENLASHNTFQEGRNSPFCEWMEKGWGENSIPKIPLSLSLFLFVREKKLRERKEEREKRKKIVNKINGETNI